MQFKTLPAALLATGLTLSGHSHATNGMIMEGYGPIATALGGAAMAYDNGNAAMANNPATLALMAEGSRLDLALGFIGPDVSSSMHGSSSADAFYMPAFGYTRKQGALTYGLGVYAQGGMGTEYANGDMAQVGVGRVIFPLAYNVDGRLSIGGSVDLVWAMMDLSMDMDGDGSPDLYFKDDSDFTGKAKGYGVAGKLGFTYKLHEQISLGGAYQTGANLGKLKMGDWQVTGFDMPPILALGLAWRANEHLMLAADLKQLMWGETMNTVTIVTPGANPDAPFRQDWDDQLVVSFGAAYKSTDSLTVRIGYNHADNPIPSQNLSHIWPATVEHHFTAGFGYVLDANSTLDFSLTYAPKVKQTNPNMYFDGTQGLGAVTMNHSQTNWQLMYSKRF